MSRRSDIADEILKVLAAHKRYRTRDTVAGSVRQEIKAAPAARSLTRKRLLRILGRPRPARALDIVPAHGVGLMILRAVQAGKTVLLPSGPLVDRLTARMLEHPINDHERQIVEAAKQRVLARLGRRAHAAALVKRTTTKRSANRKTKALALLKAGKTQKQVAAQLGLDVRTIRRYQREKK